MGHYDEFYEAEAKERREREAARRKTMSPRERRREELMDRLVPGVVEYRHNAAALLDVIEEIASRTPERADG